MKKLLSVILTVITMLSVLAVPEISASAKEKVTTYQAQTNVYKCSKGTVVNDGKDFMFYSKSGKEVFLDTMDYTGFEEDALVKFFIRGNYLYYTNYVYTYDKYEYYLFRIRLDGENKKTLRKLNDDEVMIGAYGNEIIFDSYSYNIDTKKVEEKNIAYKKSLLNTSKYYYYVNSKNDLIRRDTKGKKVKLEKNVDSVIGKSGANTVIFVKNNNLYRKTKTNKAVKIFSKKSLLKRLYGFSKKQLAMLTEKNSWVSYYSCTVSEGKFVIDVSTTIKDSRFNEGRYNLYKVFSIDVNGDKYKEILSDDTAFAVHSLGVYEGKVHYTYGDYNDMIHYR